MSPLKDILRKKIPSWRRQIQSLLTEHPEMVISEITVEQLFRGLRGVQALVCDTSYVHPDEGLYIRGNHISRLIHLYPEEIFYLLCTGEIPTENEFEALKDEINSRTRVPEYIWDLIQFLPEDVPPMSVLSIALLALGKNSIFRKRYREGFSKANHWEATLEDALTILAQIPVVAAAIYRLRILGQDKISPNVNLDLGANFARMLGIDDSYGPFTRLIRLFILLHCDHEGGSVSINTCRIVNSALSDLYLSISAGLNGLAGPLHGNANQDSVRFAQEILKVFGGVPSHDQLRQYVIEYLNGGKILPGFGHAVLRGRDPRFEALYQLGKQACSDDPLFRIVEILSQVVPPLLKAQGKVKDPYPNIDAISGVMLYHFGMTQLEFYPVMFAIPLLLGMSAQVIINRAVYSPIFRPRSVTTHWVKETLRNLKKK